MGKPADNAGQRGLGIVDHFCLAAFLLACVCVCIRMCVASRGRLCV